jgi:hypothetical protein
MPIYRAVALLAAVAVVAVLLAGCASTKAETNWQGRKIDEAIADLGPPTRVTPSGTTTLYVWEFRHEEIPRFGMGGSAVNVTTRGWTRMMTVNASGIVISDIRQDL